MTRQKPTRVKLGVSHATQRSDSLLHMLYTASEIAEVFDVSRRAIVDHWLKLGMPCTQDQHGHYWFNGRDVAAWIRTMNADQEREPADLSTMYCTTCGKRVTPLNVRNDETPRHKFARGTCPNCQQELRRLMGTKARTSW